MKIYIASSLRNKKAIYIYNKLKERTLNCYNPALEPLNETIDEERKIIFERCLYEIEYNCDIILAIAPYRRSVSGEVAYAGCLKLHGRKKIIILYNSSGTSPCKEEIEAIQGPFFDAVFDDLEELIRYIKSLSNC